MERLLVLERPLDEPVSPTEVIVHDTLLVIKMLLHTNESSPFWGVKTKEPQEAKLESTHTHRLEVLLFQLSLPEFTASVGPSHDAGICVPRSIVQNIFVKHCYY